ncbi:hypothetical protein [Arcobacter sp. LA11]|uniref:hypothetical protein n=1 Tax=Arcobacter sp. LA11 TaxID=1898176 RepID=UPI00093359CD|nr:hypothetical protein [Arcobacter sp. LA11]
MYKKIIVNTFDTVFKNSQSLLQKLLIPIILISIINFYLPQFITPTDIDVENIDLSTNESILSLVLVFILIMTNLSIAITTHRIAILGSSSVPKFGSYIFGLREFKFLFKSILMMIIIAIPVMLLVFIPSVGVFIAIFIAIILTARLSFIYPAIACDEDSSFYNSWKNTKGHTLLILFTIILFPLIFSVSVGLVYSLLIEFLIKLISPNLNILYSLLNVFITVFSISALSSAYLYIKPRPLNKVIKNEPETVRNIIEKKQKDLYKIIIHDKQKVTFKSLKKELEEQYHKIGFTDIAYDRENAFILKNEENEEAYISLRYENDEFTIQTKKTDEPILKVLQNKSSK